MRGISERFKYRDYTRPICDKQIETRTRVGRGGKEEDYSY
jgi:hypothetical protein